MNIRLLLTAVLFVSTNLYADSREEKVARLMQAQGLIAMFEEQLEMGRIQGEKLGKQMLEQITSQLIPNEEYKTKFSDAFNSYMDKAQPSWGADEIVNVWAQYYGKQFTDKELDGLIQYYESSLGQKDVQSSKKALVEFTNHFQKLNEPIMQSATQEYIEDLKKIVKECNCRK